MRLDELLSKQKKRTNTRGRRSSEEREREREREREPAPTRKANRRKVSLSTVLEEERQQPVTLSAPDPAILAVMYALVGFGLVMVYSASAVWADRTLHDSNALIRSQAMHALLAGSAAWIVGHYGDYRWLRRAAYPLLFVTVIMLIATVAGKGHTAGGAARWLSLGFFRVQPAEIAKLALILWLADSLAKKREQIRSFTVGFLPHALGAVLLGMLCLKQPDFGSAVMIGTLLFVMLFTAGAPLGYLLGLGILSLPVAYFVVAAADYRMKRIAAFFSDTNNYQLWESQLSFGSGGIWGVGLGESHQKLLYLPEAHTDFISSIVAEELGLVGFSAMVLMYLFLVYRGIRTSLRAPDAFGTYLCVGISLFIGIQAFTNLAVALGVFPTKGLTLPFISYGGSSLVVNCCAVGLLSNVSRLSRATSPVKTPSASGAARPVGGVS